MDDFLSSRKDKMKDVCAYSFIQQKLHSPTLVELTIWREIGNNEIITQVDVKSHGSNKDAVKAHSGMLSSQGAQGTLA